jgi:type I restriction enzyme R subunit
MSEVKAHTEDKFEIDVCKALQNSDWKVLSDRKNDPHFEPCSYDKENAILKDDLLEFIKSTQPNEWKKHQENYNGQSEYKLIERLKREQLRKGTLHILKKGIIDRGVNFKFSYSKPNSNRNEEDGIKYSKNILTAVRQLHYSNKNLNSIDIVLFLNGIAVATIELKTDFTQSIKDAIKQYKEDRLPQGEPLLTYKKGALVHFAMSTDEVYMTTKLDGKKTRFLPFNKGYMMGAGNPPSSGYKTAYMLEDIFPKDKWLDILLRFVLLETKEAKDEKGNKKIKEALIFPRFHQLEAVSKLLDTVKQEKAGKKYLIQHSAGSGKSNSIAWLTYRLHTLHDDNDNNVFDSVLVVTDRKLLDSQLRDTIALQDIKPSVIVNIDDKRGSKGKQLSKALNNNAKIITTTLQTFPNILDDVENLKDNSFAVIIDEAHSSTTGDASKKLKEALGGAKPEEMDGEDYTNKLLELRQPKNVSFFAFTATPKTKTVEMFGRKKTGEAKPSEFHLYSMKQAIEEGFILDVLKSYTTFDTFIKIAKKVNDNPDFKDKDKAARALAQFLKLHPEQIGQKVQIIVEHFKQSVMHKIGGKAKAMLVTDSRKAAVRYKKAFDEYIKEKGYSNIASIVAFSGKVKDLEKEYTESNMNPSLKGRDIREAFASEKYQVLIVANKFQTGFDEPLLHTMYVDKKLSGVTAVQTLSRLNRTHSEKKDTYILDFVNDAEDIKNAFEPYYKNTEIQAETDPNLLYDLKEKLEDLEVYLPEEVEALYKEFSKNKGVRQDKLHSFVDPALDRYKALEKEEQKEFKDTLTKFVRLYDFICQIVSFIDLDLEKLSIYGKLLKPKLFDDDNGEIVVIDPYVEIKILKVEKKAHTEIKLENNRPLAPITAVGTGVIREPEGIDLEELVKKFNELLSGDLTDNDLVDFPRTIANKVLENDELRMQAQNNPKENFKHGKYKEALQDAIIESLDTQGNIASQILSDDYKMNAFSGLMINVVYDALKKGLTNIDGLMSRK